jgi:hypothetical protein
MEELDLVYEAFQEYAKRISAASSVSAFLNEVRTADNGVESLESVSSICKINGDWVDKIALAMPFLAGACAEQRQFVRSDGTVLPIEKIKSVSRDSLTDLSKHSNYISHIEDDGRIIPDKLFLAKKESDFAVYENRFLFTLLSYLYSFIEIRLNEIMALTGRFEAHTQVDKKLSTTDHQLDFHLEITDIRYHDPLSTRKGSYAAINTLKKALNDVKALLMTPLMKEVSQAPMVKAPITKTNILRFDRNFKAAVSLYDYITAYQGKGFTIEKSYQRLNPFLPDFEGQYAEIFYLSSFLSYEFANGLSDDLKARYLSRLSEKEKEAEAKTLAEMRSLQAKIREMGISPETYIQLLEKGNAVLERQLESKDDDVRDFFKKASEDMLVYQESLDNALKETQAECDKKVADMANQLEQKEAEKKALAAAYETKLVKQAQDDELLRQKLQAEDQLRYAQLLASSKAKETQLSQEKQNLNEELEKLSETNSRLQGEVKLASYHQGKLPVSQLTSQAQFDELEAEKAAFDRFYKKAWKAAKKQIRSDVMNETLTQGIDKKKNKDKKGQPK